MESQISAPVKIESKKSIFDLLYQCTVKVILPDGTFGTGFFVSPGRILTCAHVIDKYEHSMSQVKILYNGEEYAMVDGQILPKPYPDLALLSLEIVGHPCVRINPDVKENESLFTYGYTRDFPGGEPAHVFFTGKAYTGKEGEFLLKLKDDQIKPGYSGGPLLSQETFGVCGVIKSSQNVHHVAGGGAVPITVALSKWPTLSQLQENHHKTNSQWLDTVKRQRQDLRNKALALGEGSLSDNVELSIIMAKAFSAFSNEDHRRLMSMIRYHIDTDKPEDDGRRPGSTIVDVRIPKNKIESLLLAVEAGLFKEFDVVDVVARSSQLEQRQTQLRLREERVTVRRNSVNRNATSADLDAFQEGQIEMRETFERAVISKTANIVEEISIGKEIRERDEVIRDTVRKTEVDVENLGTTDGTVRTERTDRDTDGVSHSMK